MSISYYKFIKFTVVTVALFISTACAAEVIVVDAALGTGDDVQVQAAVDDAAKGSILQLKGTFVFWNSVKLHKSDVSLIGDYEDLNGNGQPDPSPIDRWGTEIGTAIPTGFANIRAFELRPRDGDYNGAYDVSNLTLSGIKFSAGLVVDSHPFQDIGCDDPVIPHNLERFLFEENWVDEGWVNLHQTLKRVSINNNLFTSRFTGLVAFPFNVILTGAYIKNLCPWGDPRALVIDYGENNEVTNNQFLDNTNLVFSMQSMGRIHANSFKPYALPGGGPRPDSTTVINSELQSGVTISDNSVETFGGTAITIVAAQTQFPVVDVQYSKNLDIKNNTIKGATDGILIFGGIANSSIKGNHISQYPGGVGNSGIGMFDNATGLRPEAWMVNSSSKVDITNNHIESTGLAGIGLNGDTTGVKMVNNTFSSNYGPDIFLLHADLFGGATPCPTHDNVVISTNFSINLLDLAPIGIDCGGGPNKHLGTLNLLEQVVSPEAQANFDAMRDRLIEEAAGRPQVDPNYLQ